MPDTQQAFSAVKKADETIALLIQHQPNLIQEQYPSAETGESIAALIGTLRAKLIDMYNLTPPL